MKRKNESKGPFKKIKWTIDHAPGGIVFAAFNIIGKIIRRECCFNWNAALETGGVLVSYEVRINCEMQLAKQS